MNKFIKLFFGVDLFAGLSLITSLIAKIFFSNDTLLFVSIAVIFAIVNVIITIIITKRFNFYKNVNEYEKK